ncbi:uncharacterized protein BO88DRAFT_417018 [Aspergillus vadensis CBS 113365]|uniref:Grh/CP2 DB domain-containing protein n=1 Tax=Aspergillus vadensis (strain CBS 113365 / IMI 142717 / IBT 24658) TaxID=1448311 RepID=A0A319B3L0_ASPVC|nr:hypothetical protein BO88DRAFT_417018 [Aspergillus vadensis CBS 113365]PYH67099.1 hypothetical protein BO88DRAFT_417018 [Aspergillus vadensis CBS 113365]
MFRNRKNSQKPDDLLIQKFRKTFSDIVFPVVHRNATRFGQTPIGPITLTRREMNNDTKLSDSTPRTTEDMRFPAPYTDPNAVSYVIPLQPHRSSTPNSGRLGAVYHSQAGELHFPVMGLSMITPLSLPQQLFAQQPTFAPTAFVQSDAGYDTMDESVEEHSLNNMDVQSNTPSHNLVSSIQDDQASIMNPGETLCYRITLCVPTAMINDQAEIPVTYLNKGQVYSVSVIDCIPPSMTMRSIKYRIYIHFSLLKGVEGIPVRLCAKTEMLSPDYASSTPGREAEVYYCKVKLFHDHGAERKLSCDVAHIAQAEMGSGNCGKRKYSNGLVVLKGADPRPAKITKYKRVRPMGLQDGPGKMRLEGDLHAKLALMQVLGDMVTLKYPVKVPKFTLTVGNANMGYIEAVDIDPNYHPPAERPVISIAYFYVRFPCNDRLSDDYYRAVYLTERTVRDLIEKITIKQRIDPQRVVRVLHVKQNGLEIMVDDDVRELPDGQDMIVEMSEVSSFKNAAVTGPGNPSSALELKLSY